MASNDSIKFRDIVKENRHVVVLTGAGVSVDSSVPVARDTTYMGYNYYELANGDTFKTNPALVWSYYQVRKDIILSKSPNAAHYALADFENRLRKQKDFRLFTLITTNVDGLHDKAGSSPCMELYGNLQGGRCTLCDCITRFDDNPFSLSLQEKCNSEVSVDEISEADLPHCQYCHGLLRPNVVWPGEPVIEFIEAIKAVEMARLGIVVGCSFVSQSMTQLVRRMTVSKQAPVAEFNIQKTTETPSFDFHFAGRCSETLPPVLEGIFSD